MLLSAVWFLGVWGIPEFEVPAYIPSIELLKLLAVLSLEMLCFNLLSTRNFWKNISEFWDCGTYALRNTPSHVMVSWDTDLSLAHTLLSWLKYRLPLGGRSLNSCSSLSCLTLWAVLVPEEKQQKFEKTWQILRVTGYLEFKYFIKIINNIKKEKVLVNQKICWGIRRKVGTKGQVETRHSSFL